MTFLKVLLVILAVLWLVSLIRVGGRVSYGQAGLFVTALAGPFKIQVLPLRPKKEKKPGKAKKPKKKKPPVAEEHKKEPEEGRPGTLSQLIWGGTDPAAAALGYGRANAALGMLWPVLDNNFKVKHHSFQVGLDYGRTEPAAEVRAAVTITVGQIITLGVRYGIKALVTWIRSGKGPRKKQEAMSHE